MPLFFSCSARVCNRANRFSWPSLTLGSFFRVLDPLRILKDELIWFLAFQFGLGSLFSSLFSLEIFQFGLQASDLGQQIRIVFLELSPDAKRLVERA